MLLVCGRININAYNFSLLIIPNRLKKRELLNLLSPIPSIISFTVTVFMYFRDSLLSEKAAIARYFQDLKRPAITLYQKWYKP
ncbi:hypothetical protein Lbru_0006 [Legionella brunensis]|uniref:Uncharacterized protein n=1 Tax=Legionella brunensis TaxID=29422 RepID=A0A0W0SV72_9GAMM|nr:hypothetical protein Lbru_0006 [Legionella brunensis]